MLPRLRSTTDQAGDVPSGRYLNRCRTGRNGMSALAMPEDWRISSSVTLGAPVIMGRRTWSRSRRVSVSLGSNEYGFI